MIRFISVAARAARLPKSKVRMEATAKSGASLPASGWSGPVTRMNKINAPAAFEAVPRKVVVGVGAP